MKAAFEVGKGAREVLTLSEADVVQHLDPAELLHELEASFGALARGEVQCPPRPEVTVPGRGFSLTMSAWQPGMQICVKVVNVFDGNLARSLPNHLAIITLFDPETGALTCVMDATYITGIRTAAAAVLSHKLLSRPESRIATIVGAGVQAREHLRLLPLVRDFDEIQICSLEYRGCRAIGPSASEGAGRSRCTGGDRTLGHRVPRHALGGARHRRGLGAARNTCVVGRLSPARWRASARARTRSRVFVETLDAFAATPVGCAELSGLDGACGTTLGDVVNDRRKGRVSDVDITVYKAMGIAMEDMVAANLVYRTVQRSGGGGSMKW